MQRRRRYRAVEYVSIAPHKPWAGSINRTIYAAILLVAVACRSIALLYLRMYHSRTTLTVATNKFTWAVRCCHFQVYSDGYIDVITGCPPVCLLFRCVVASRNIPRGFFAREAMPRRWPQSRMVGIKLCLSREVRRRVPRAGTVPACTVL